MSGTSKKPLALIIATLWFGIIGGCGYGDMDYDAISSMSVAELNGLELHYRFTMIEPSIGGADAYLQVDFSFVMPQKRLALQLPNRFLRRERLYDRLERLQVVSNNAAISNADKPEFRILAGRKDERVTIRYFLRGDDPHKPAGKESFSAPIIRSDFFMFVGQMALLVPAGLASMTREFNIRLDWEMPPTFKVYNSFAAQKIHQNIVTNGIDFWDSIFIGGSRIRAYEIKINKKPVVITFEGHWSRIPDEQFIDAVGRLIRVQRETWRDNNFPYFLVNFLAMGEGCNGNKGHKFAGTAHKNSFRAYFPKDCDLQPNMKQLISHELMHNWIGKKIKMGEERGHIDGKFLTEGLSDYYGRKFAYRAGIFSMNDYFETLNRVLHSYQISTERLAPLRKLVDQMYKKPYTNQDLEQLPYQQGELMALQINKKIMERSNFKYSLDDVIRDMLAEAERSGGSKNFTPDEIGSIIDRYAPSAFQDEYQKIRDGSATLVPPSLAQCSEPELTNTLWLGGNPYQTRQAIFAYKRLYQCDQWLK